MMTMHERARRRRVLSPDSPTGCSPNCSCHGPRLRARRGGPVRRHPPGAVNARIFAVSALLFLVACSSEPRPTTGSSAAPAQSATATPNDRGLQTVALPDISRTDASVQEQLRGQYAALEARLADPGTSDTALAQAFGEMGKLLMATELFDAAEAPFNNARALEPRDMRWPYYLAHLYRLRNQPETAAALFEAALALRPTDTPTLLWLGEMYLSSNRPDEAELLFEKALAADPELAPAFYGLGRVALVRQDFAEAVAQLERALERAPQATRLEYVLGLAYRGLGDTARAEAHLARRGDVELLPRDPLMSELPNLLQGAAAFAVRGAQALTTGDFDAAVADLQRAAELAPDNPSTRLNLGSALYFAGDRAAAIPHFEAAVRLSPEDARAHYALGVLRESGTTPDGSDGDDAAALEHFRIAVRYDPTSVELRISLGDALRRTGRVQTIEESLSHYAEALRLDPAVAAAQFGYAMALVRLGRYGQARQWLEEGFEMFPDQPGFPHALARLLAAAPDDAVRDGRQALLLVQPLIGGEQNVALSETMAMTMAELGDFDEAIGWQRTAIAAAEQAGRTDLVADFSENLALYEKGRPCRTPWRDDDPVFNPRPSN